MGLCSKRINCDTLNLVICKRKSNRFLYIPICSYAMNRIFRTIFSLKLVRPSI